MNENELKQKIREDFWAYVSEQVHPDDLNDAEYMTSGRIEWLQGRFIDDFDVYYLTRGEKTSTAQNDYSDEEQDFLSVNPAWANVFVDTVRAETQMPDTW